MASSIHPETGAFTRGPPPESSDFAPATNTTTDTAVKPVAEHTVDASAAAMAALQELTQGPNPSEEVGLTFELDIASCLGEDPEVSQLKALRAIICRSLRTSPKGSSTLQGETLELLPYMLDGTVKYMNQQKKAQQEKQSYLDSLLQANRYLQDRVGQMQASMTIMQDDINRLRATNAELDAGKRDFQTAAIRSEQLNYQLRMEMEKIEAERGAGIVVGDGSLTESDGEGPSRKRKKDGM